MPSFVHVFSSLLRRTPSKLRTDDVARNGSERLVRLDERTIYCFTYIATRHDTTRPRYRRTTSIEIYFIVVGHGSVNNKRHDTYC